jgi:hypothetical protein
LPDPASTTRRARQRHVSATQAAQRATARTEVAPRRGTSTSKPEDARVAGSIDDAVVVDWLKRQCEPYGHGPTITNPLLLRRIATLAFAGLDEEATASPSASSQRRPGRRRGPGPAGKP